MKRMSMNARTLSRATLFCLVTACGGGAGDDGESGDTEGESSANTDTNATSDSSTTSDTNSSGTSASTTTSTTDASATDTSTDDGSSDGSGGCEVGFSCIPDIPSGWTGPVILAENPGGGSPSCGGDYASEVQGGLNVGLNADPAECGCSCGTPTNVVCKGNLNRSLPGDDTCGASQQASELVSDICSYVAVQGDEFVFMTDAYLFSGQCTGAATENLPDPTWDAGAAICGTSQTEFDVCDDGVCAPYDSRLCVVKVGEMGSCPMGYPYPVEAWTGYYDDRACSSCSCEVEEDCTGTVSLYQSGGGLCNTPSPETVSGDGSCHDAIAGGYQSAFWEIPSMSCGVSQPSNPTGSVAGQNGTTVCCTSE